MIRDANQILNTHQVLKIFVQRQMKARKNIKLIDQVRIYTNQEKKDKLKKKQDEVR